MALHRSLIFDKTARLLLPRRCWIVVENNQTLACLSKLQLLCVHPSLVVDAEDGGKRREMGKDVQLSGKLMVLRELLWDAGIGERSADR